MANPYKHPKTGAFLTKRQAQLANAKAQRAGEALPFPQQATLTQGNKGTSASQTTIVMPPFDPANAAGWMRLAAARAWEKFPERAASVGLRKPPYPTAGEFLTPEQMAAISDFPAHTESAVTAQRVMQYLLARFNPIRGMNPQRLGTYLEQWNLGFLRWLSLAWSMIRERDDQIKAVVTKREFAVCRLPWEIVTKENSAEADTHKQALVDFYNGLTCTHVLDQNEQGGVNLLLRQMMRAIGDKFAVHEIVWQPDAEKLTAHFRYVPMWFFENRTGQLRYLPYELALDGIPLDAGGWLVTSGDGLHVATSIAYIYKQLGLKDWARYSEKFGIPTLIAKTTAAFGSQEWTQMLTALSSWASDGVVLVNKMAEFESHNAGATGELPQEKLVDRMDRAIARLWRGGDLSTNSRAGAGIGALPQIQQEDEITAADSILLSEALNQYVDKWVLKYRFDSESPKAMFRIVPPKNVDINKEIATDTFLINNGVQVGQNDLLKRYGRAKMPVDDTPAKPVIPPKPDSGEPPTKASKGIEGD